MVISIYPDKKLKAKLEELSKKENRSLNNLILHILTKHLSEGGKHGASF